MMGQKISLKKKMWAQKGISNKMLMSYLQKTPFFASCVLFDFGPPLAASPIETVPLVGWVVGLMIF